MEVTSHYLESADLGQLHITRFTPPGAVPGAERGTYFGGVNSRATTLDTFGTAHVLAQSRGMVVDVIDRPGNGSSTLPENAYMRKDYDRFGFVAVCAAVQEAQENDALFKPANRMHGFGGSLGGNAAALYLESFRQQAASALFIDSAIMQGETNQLSGMGQYFGYTVGEAVMNKLHLKPRINNLYGRHTEIIGAYQRFRDTYHHLPVNPKKSAEANRAERRELFRIVDGNGLKLATTLLRHAVEDNRTFELRASHSPARAAVDRQSVAHVNAAFAAFDADYPSHNSVKYGFLQRDMYWWHDLASAPSTVRELATAPMDRLQTRLK